MVIFKCYFSGEHIALSLKNNYNDVNIELGQPNRLKALCMVPDNTQNKQTMCQCMYTLNINQSSVSTKLKKHDFTIPEIDVTSKLIDLRSSATLC